MKAMRCHAYGPVEQLSFDDIKPLIPKKGEVIVAVKAAGVNFPDALLIQGLYQVKPPCPFIPGTEVAGEICALGEGVTHLNIGQRVIAICQLGGYAQQVSVPVTHVMPLPDAIPFDEGSALVTAHATAHHALKQRAMLQPDETLVVTGAAGGTGLAAVQIGKVMGARVIAVCSTPEKLAVAEQNGADVLIHLPSDADPSMLKDAIKQHTNGKGADVIYECVGGEVFHACSRAMAWNGRLLVIGFAGGSIPEFPVNLALVKGYSVVGVYWGSFTQHQPAAFVANMKELLGWYVSRKVKVVIDRSFSLAEAAHALHYVTGRNVKGKVVLLP